MKENLLKELLNIFHGVVYGTLLQYFLLSFGVSCRMF